MFMSFMKIFLKEQLQPPISALCLSLLQEIHCSLPSSALVKSHEVFMKPDLRPRSYVGVINGDRCLITSPAAWEGVREGSREMLA